MQADAEVMDVSVQVNFDRTTAQDTWTNLTTDFSSVTKLEAAFQEARREAEVCYDMFAEPDKPLTASPASINKFTTEVPELRDSLKDLNTTHSSLMKDSPNKREEISSLPTR